MRERGAIGVKKGELKRSSILKAAEMLFFERGYERTSVQDILDALSLSKGGFYHHFPSKEAVLEEICAERVSGAAGAARHGAVTPGRPRPRSTGSNLLLRAVNPLERDDAPFVALTLKVCYVDRDARPSATASAASLLDASCRRAWRKRAARGRRIG